MECDESLLRFVDSLKGTVVSCWELPEVLAELVEFRSSDTNEAFDELWTTEDWDKMWGADYEGPNDT